jgi:aryl-alcohol dehydrogenase-like predicted oxidoreductase
MEQRKIGTASVGAMGLGCMGMSFAYGGADHDESIRTLHRALELGVNHWDTADMYGSGANETLLSEVLKDRRDEVFLATKFGNVYDKTMTSHQDLAATDAPIVDGTPAYARKCLEASLKRLGVDHVDLYTLHRIDDRTPVEETIGAMAEFVREGKVRFLGVSEASVPTVQRAHTTHPLAAVQNELSLWTRDFEDTVLPLCAELGIAFVPYSPLGRGFLTGEIKSPDDLAEDDWRRRHPRFQAENFQKNLDLVATVKNVAARKNVLPAQVALAWVLAKGKHVAPIPGTKRVKYLEQNVAALNVELDATDMKELDAIPETSGRRYAAVGMTFVNR